jgi:hypothetical protein
MAANNAEKTVGVASNVPTDSATLELEKTMKVQTDDADNSEHLEQLRLEYGVCPLLLSPFLQS